LNDRAKCASETRLTRASRCTGQSSCEAASIRSFARNRRRNSSGSWLVESTLVMEELEIEIERILINGVDIFKFSDGGRLITHSKVMVRPVEAIILLQRLIVEQH
jgi:hypothetical protein